MADYGNAWAAAASSTYLGVLIAPVREVCLALSPDAARVWTEVIGTLAAAPPDDSEAVGPPLGGRGARGAAPRPGAPAARPRGGGPGRAGAGPAQAAAAARAARQQPGGPAGGAADALADAPEEPGVARGALRFTKRMSRLIVSTGDVDLLHQALLLLDRHSAELHVA
jgi:hypothetical protein